MIDPAILATIRSRLARAQALPAGVRYRPFVVGNAEVGAIDDARADRLARFANVFVVSPGAVVLASSLGDPAARSAALADVAIALRDEGALPAWRDELYEIAMDFGAPPLFHIERGAARYFGVRTFAAHVNGIVDTGDATTIWLARRSVTKAVDPGLFDNLVGGGIAAGLSIEATVIKESWEEAGIEEALASAAIPVGAVHVRRPMFDGLQRETLFVHDLALPAAFVPINRDGEASEHRRVDLALAAVMIARDSGPDAVTVEASLVVLDYLARQAVAKRNDRRSRRLPRAASGSETE